MADAISFDTIPGGIRVPGRYIEFNTRNADQGLPQNPQKGFDACAENRWDTARAGADSAF